MSSKNCTEFKLNCKLNKIIILLQIGFFRLFAITTYVFYLLNSKIASHSYLEVRAPWRSSSGFSWRSPTRVSTSRRMRRSSSATKLRTVRLTATYKHLYRLLSQAQKHLLNPSFKIYNKFVCTLNWTTSSTFERFLIILCIKQVETIALKLLQQNFICIKE